MEFLGSTISDPTLRDTLSIVTKNASKLWQRGLVHHPDFTLHGIIHSQKISETLKYLSDHIPAAYALNDKEKFILTSSAYLHDIGMLFPLNGYIKEQVSNNPGLKKYSKIESCEQIIKEFCQSYGYDAYADAFFQNLKEKPLPNSVRDGEIVRYFHHIFSDYLIKKHGETLGILRHAIPLVATISKGHRVVDLRNEEYRNTSWSGSSIRRGPLAALLRVSDELDFSSERAPDIIFEIFIEDLLQDPQSLAHWIRHFCIRSVGPIEITKTSEGYIRPTMNIVADLPNEDYRALIDEQIQKSYSQISSVDVNECLQRIGMCSPNIQSDVNVDPSPTALPSPLLSHIGDLKPNEFIRHRMEEVVLDEEQNLLRDGFDYDAISRMLGYKRKLYKVEYDCLDLKEVKVTWEIHIQATQQLSHIRHFYEQTDEPFELISDLDFAILTPNRRIKTTRRLTRGDTNREIDIIFEQPLNQDEEVHFRFSETYRNLIEYNRQTIKQKVADGSWPFDEVVYAVGTRVRVPTDELHIRVSLPEGVQCENPHFKTRLTETTILYQAESDRLQRLKCFKAYDSGGRKIMSLVVTDPKLMVTYWLAWEPLDTERETT